eukprot:scaffold93206_cov57-Phaeocystis_antarctica.AAC.4
MPLVLLIVVARVLARVVLVDHLLHVLPLRLLRLVPPLLLALLLVDVLHVTRDVAAVGGEVAPAQLHHVGDHVVEESSVVGDDEQRCLALVLQPLGEPRERGEVEVVGRLVEQQDVAWHEECGGEGDAHAPASRERAQGCAHHLRRELQPRQDGGRLGLGRLLVAQLSEQRLRLLAPLLHARGVPVRRALLPRRRHVLRRHRLLELGTEVRQPAPQQGSLEVVAQHLVRVRVKG